MPHLSGQPGPGRSGALLKYKDFTVNDLVSQALPVSAKIGSVAFLLAVTLGVTFGTIAALKQNTLIDYLLMSSAMAGVVIRASCWHRCWCSSSVSISAGSGGAGWGRPVHELLPVFGMMMYYISAISRIMRGSMIETMNSNFIRTARAKGLPCATSSSSTLLPGHASGLLTWDRPSWASSPAPW